MRTMILAVSFVVLTGPAAIAKEVAILECDTQFNLLRQDITDGLAIKSCVGAGGTPCIDNTDCPTGQRFCSGSGPECAGVIKLLFKHGYKLVFSTPKPIPAYIPAGYSGSVTDIVLILE